MVPDKKYFFNFFFANLGQVFFLLCVVIFLWNVFNSKHLQYLDQICNDDSQNKL